MKLISYLCITKQTTMIIDLVSNDTSIDTDTLVITPFFSEGKGIHIDEVDDDWFDTLDDHDFGTISNLLDKRSLQETI